VVATYTATRIGAESSAAHERGAVVRGSAGAAGTTAGTTTGAGARGVGASAGVGAGDALEAGVEAGVGAGAGAAGGALQAAVIATTHAARNLVRLNTPMRVNLVRMATLLSDADLSAALTRLSGWQRHATPAGPAIARTFTFRGFPESIAFVVRAAFPSEALDHHPDLDVRYNRVVVVLATHSMGGVTDLDITLAGHLDAIAASSSA
jgi:4a-hydroxytetrahydrobiopterin dehydratase